ncbi:glycosyltransferase [candidate division GN15 bacterium]|nr:glycosyltransferase [candidate division GN15 bacterium]
MSKQRDDSKLDEHLVHIDDYQQFIGQEAIDRIYEKARPLQGKHIAHVNATYYGGGVASLLSSFILLMNSVGIKTGWRVLQGSPDFFGVTKKMHNGLQGGEINLSDQKKKVYESVVYENTVRNHLDHDLVIIHDPQPLPMIAHYNRRGPWIWRCHVDLTERHGELWQYLQKYINMYDAAVFSLEEYRQDIKPPQLFFQPAIDPFCLTNKELSEEEVQERLDHHDIPTDLPLIVQISRFDRWKDPRGVIEAFKKARKDIDATLVLLGNVATDDPEGDKVFESLLNCREERIIILSQQDTALVNALQRRAAVVVQKSIREGFGLTVAEAMWKSTPVIGGNVGGIRYQIKDGHNGYLVSSVEETAQRMVQIVKDNDLRNELGKNARKTVEERYLLTRYLENYLDLFNSFETVYRLKKGA